MAKTIKETYTVLLYGIDFEVTVEIDKPSFGTHDTPGDNGSIEIIDVTYNGTTMTELIEEVNDYEELIIKQIRKQL